MKSSGHSTTAHIGSHAPRVPDRGDSEKAHGLAMTHRESLSRFDTSRLRGGVAAAPLDSPAGFSGLLRGPLSLRRLTGVTSRTVKQRFADTPKTLPVMLRMP
jgi:hypothetical protein